MPPTLYTEKTEVTVSDRTLVSIGPAHPVSRSVKTLASVFDWTLGHLVIGHWKVASGLADMATHRGVAV